jgi:hypothetical protein
MKSLFLVVLFGLASKGLFAQAGSNVTNSAAKESVNSLDTTNMAKIFVIRSTGHVGSAVNLRVLVNDVNFCKIKNNRYAMFYVNPGVHIFNATSWDKPGTDAKFALNVPVEAGKTYYMSMKMKQKFFGIEITLEEITYNTAAPMLEKYKRDECD